MFEPDKSLKECYESLELLRDEAFEASKALAATGDEALAAILSSLYISNQNQFIIMWHLLARIEKKIDDLSDSQPYNYGKPKKRF